ncbi:hypothetical protein MHYP_G00232530 [Metynnis hypsauchen]
MLAAGHHGGEQWQAERQRREGQFQHFLRPEFKYGSDVHQSSKECSYQRRLESISLPPCGAGLAPVSVCPPSTRSNVGVAL